MMDFKNIPAEKIDEVATNTIRLLAAEGIQAANSGHPGLPMGIADVTHVLWSKFLNVDPKDPNWINRDRFVLSAGHGSMLIYSMLHLAGFNLPLEELKQFRQLGSLTPGHPEYGHTEGVDTTTGPLGAGFSNAVGFALAERMLASRFNTSSHNLIDHYTYTITGDGCNMEGITSEAASIAGHLKLNKLICFYDDNEISIEGNTDLAFTEDVNKRFEAYNWHVQDIDGHNQDAIAEAIEIAKAEKEKPSIIVCHTKIGRGSPNKEGSASAHGEPLGVDELAVTKENLGFPKDKDFFVPDAVRDFWAKRNEEWKKTKDEWNKVLEDFRKTKSTVAKKFDRAIAGELPKGFRKAVEEFAVGTSVASRSSGGQVLNMLAAKIPELVGGSADLAPSTKTLLNDFEYIMPGKYNGRNIHYGVREHAMGGISNGLALHGGFIPFCATFMVFVDYMRPTLRLAALMKLRSIFYLTHDSIFVGEDGPTHQPVEHIPSMRIIPNLNVMRPCDANEVAEALCIAVESKETPTVLALTRQNLPTLDRTECAPVKMAQKGGYILKEAPSGKPDIVLISSGSEVHAALDAYDKLVAEGHQPRVVSMMCMEIFDQQKGAYQRKVLSRGCKKKVAIEATNDPAWRKYIGDKGLFIGMDDFGQSGPAAKLADIYGFTGDGIIKKIKEAGMI